MRIDFLQEITEINKKLRFLCSLLLEAFLGVLRVLAGVIPRFHVLGPPENLRTL
jgi:hypothetical protein